MILISVADWPHHHESDCVVVSILSHGTSQKAPITSLASLRWDRDYVVQTKCDVLQNITSNPDKWRQFLRPDYDYWKDILMKQVGPTTGVTAQQLKSKAIKHSAMTLAAWADLLSFQHQDQPLVWKHKLSKATNEYDALDRIIESKPGAGNSLVYGTDGVTITLDQVISPFKECKGLWGKPKIFFIQVSHGYFFR